jgi:glycosyltransferase involved in cell wall biosynthesis
MFSEVDVAIVPSVIESYSRVVRESLSAGVPVLASAVGGIPEIIEHMRNGILFDPYDEHDLTRQLQNVVDDPSLVRRLREGITPPKTIDEDSLEWADRYERLLSPASFTL